MSINHHYLMLKKWHPANKANRTVRYEKELEETDRKRRESAARVELNKRREKYLFDKMVEMRDGKRAFNEKEMDLDFMYAVPSEIAELDKKQKRQNVDEEVIRFQKLYLNPQQVVSELPKEALEDKEESSEDERGRPKDPRKNNPMELFEKQIKEEDGKLNYDRVNDIIRKYNNTTNEKPNTIEEKHMQQFSSRAIQISKNLYLKTEEPIGGDIDPSLNTFVDSSSDDDSDAEVKRYLEGLSEKDRALLLQKLEGKETTHHHSTHKHKHHHHKKRHSYSLFYNKQTICYCNA